MKLTRAVLALFALTVFASLFLPSVTLFYQAEASESLIEHSSERYFDGARYVLSPSKSLSDQDPLGYNALLRVTFFRTVPSYLFEPPPQQSNFGMVRRNYDKDFLKSFAQANGIEGVWAGRESLTREAEAIGYDLRQCNFLSSYSLYRLVLPVAQPQPHFISLLEAGEDYIYAFDPLVGNVLYPCESFLEVWEGAVFLGRPFSSKHGFPVQGS